VDFHHLLLAGLCRRTRIHETDQHQLDLVIKALEEMNEQIEGQEKEVEECKKRLNQLGKAKK
jgi:hypothetical protein